jgi:hypothetical protein
VPLTRDADYYLDAKPFMLQRQGVWRGRAWRRTAQVNVPGRASSSDEQSYSALPEQIDFAETWTDWSDGAFHAYRESSAPNTYHWGQDVDARFPNQLIHGQEIQRTGAWAIEAYLNIPNIAAGTLPEFTRPGAGAVLALEGSFIDHNVANGVAFYNTRINTPGVNWGHRPVMFGSYIYLPTLQATVWRRLDFAYSIDSGAVGGMKGFGFAVAGNRLWRYWGDTPERAIYVSSVAEGSPPGTGNWSATLTIGDGASNIVDMVSLNDQVYVGTNEGVYVGDQSGTFYNILSEVNQIRHTDNCRDLSVFQGAMMIPHITGLYSYYPSTTTAIVREVGPATRTSNTSPVRGYIRAGRSLGPWYYAGLWTGSQSYLLAGREKSNGWVWHTQQRIPDVARVHRLHFDAVTVSSGALFRNLPSRLWVATDASIGPGGTASEYWSVIPQNNDNPVADTTFSARYNGSFRIDMGSTDRRAPGTQKLYRRVEVWADSLVSGAQYGDIYYTVDGGTRTLLGRAQTSPVSNLYFPSTRGSFTLGRSIVISLESFTASLNTTPVYRALVLHGAILAEKVDIITAQTRVADNLRDRAGGEMRPGAVMLSELRQWATPSYGPVELVGPLGVSEWVKVLPPVEETEVWQDGTEYPEINASVRMAVLTFTAF